MKKQIITITTLVLGFLVGATALSAIAQTSGGTWTAPSATAPGNNVPAPINVGSTGQAKSGLLALANLVFNPTGVVGSVVPGSVLTSTDNAGTVGWQPSAGFLPSPAYDSGWITVPSTVRNGYNRGGWGAFQTTVFHNLNSTNTLVYLEWRDNTNGLGTTGLFNGGEEFSGGTDVGFSWANKSTNSIAILRSKDEPANSTVRVLMWKINQ